MKGNGRGTTEPFDPATLRDLDDPFPRYGALRAEGPVVALASGRSAVFGYEAAASIMRDPRFRSAPLGALYASMLAPGALHDEMSRRINFLDPPDHPRVRGLVAKAFTPRRVNDLRGWIDATASRLVETLPVVDGTIEVMHGLAHPLPSLVISQLLGVPIERRDELTELSDAITPVFGTSVTAEDRDRAVAAAELMHGILGAEMDQRRRDPADDLLTALVTVEDAGERLSHAELMSLVATLYSAGHRTTRDLFGNGLELLLAQGELADSLPFDVRLVDEITRLATPTHYVARFATASVDIGLATIASGTPVMVFLAAANRDPAMYEHPDRFDPARSGPPALSFALGPHFCLGASLARAEVQAMLGALAARYPHAVAAARPRRWHQRGPFRGLDELTLDITRDIT